MTKSSSKYKTPLRDISSSERRAIVVTMMRLTAFLKTSGVGLANACRISERVGPVVLRIVADRSPATVVVVLDAAEARIFAETDGGRVSALLEGAELAGQHAWSAVPATAVVEMERLGGVDAGKT